MTEGKHLRLPEFVFYDDIRLSTRSRYKDSEVSGSEWRTVVEIEFGFKGIIVARASAVTMPIAVAMLGGHFYNDFMEVDLRAHRARENACCDQPECKNEWTTIAWLKERFTGDGEKIIGKYAPRYFRRFCDEHKERGEDAGWEDCDKNYEMERRP